MHAASFRRCGSGSMTHRSIEQISTTNADPAATRGVARQSKGRDRLAARDLTACCREAKLGYIFILNLTRLAPIAAQSTKARIPNIAVSGETALQMPHHEGVNPEFA